MQLPTFSRNKSSLNPAGRDGLAASNSPTISATWICSVRSSKVLSSGSRPNQHWHREQYPGRDFEEKTYCVRPQVGQIESSGRRWLGQTVTIWNAHNKGSYTNGAGELSPP